MIKALENADFDMPTYLQSPSGRKALCRTINKLTRENLITPVGRKPQTTEGLFLKYRINKERTQNDDIIRREIIKSIAPPGKLDYYLKNTGDYLKDMDIIKIISQFLIKEGTDYITVNERSYELFGDEKFFKGDEKTRSRGEVVLRRLGLDYSDLRCYETPEPFFSFIKKSFYTQDSRKIIIIENKDTFWSFKK